MGSIKLAGKEYEIKELNLNDYVALEEQIGSLTKIQDDMSLTKIRKILTFVLKKSDPNLTEDAVGSMIVPNTENFKNIMKEITKALGGGADKPLPT